MCYPGASELGVQLADDVDQTRIVRTLCRHRDRAVAHRFSHAKIATEDQRERDYLHQLNPWHH